MIELTRDNIHIHGKGFVVVKGWEPITIGVYVECRSNAGEKFGVNSSVEYGAPWIELYAFYNPLENYLRMEYDIVLGDGCKSHSSYTPIPTERETIISMLEECCKKETGMTCSEWLQKELKKK